MSCFICYAMQLWGFQWYSLKGIYLRIHTKLGCDYPYGSVTVCAATIIPASNTANIITSDQYHSTTVYIRWISQRRNTAASGPVTKCGSITAQCAFWHQSGHWKTDLTDRQCYFALHLVSRNTFDPSIALGDWFDWYGATLPWEGNGRSRQKKYSFPREEKCHGRRNTLGGKWSVTAGEMGKDSFPPRSQTLGTHSRHLRKSEKNIKIYWTFHSILITIFILLHLSHKLWHTLSSSDSSGNIMIWNIFQLSWFVK